MRGETGHYDFVAGECASGIQRVQLSTGMPVIFGVLTTETLEQALARSEPDDEGNKGREAALTGIEMVRLLRTRPLVLKPTFGQSVRAGNRVGEESVAAGVAGSNHSGP